MFCCTCEKQSLNKYQWMCCVILIALLLVKTLTLASNPTVSSAPGIQFPPCHSSQHYRTHQSGRWRLAAEETCCSVNKSYFKLALSYILAQHFLKIVVAWWEYILYLTVVHSSRKLITAHRELWTVVAVHPLPCVIQMLEVMRRH